MNTSINSKKGNFEFTIIAGRKCFIFLPKDYKNEKRSYPTVYLSGDESNYLMLKEADFISKLSYIIIGIISENRLDELTPWEGSSLHPKFPDFGGKGDGYIEFIKTKLKPAVDLKYRTLSLPQSTAIMGYSLGGLISMYSAFNTSCFGYFVSISGSFWYKDFISYANEHSVKNSDSKIYISSGDKEGEGSKDIKKDAVNCTKKLYDILVSDLTDSRVEIFWDKGGHHQNIYERYERALLWLNNNLKKE